MKLLQIRECRLSNGSVAGHSSRVIPAKRSASRNPGFPVPGTSWIPAFAGMTDASKLQSSIIFLSTGL